MKKALKSVKELRCWRLKRRKKGDVVGELELQVAEEKAAYIYNYLLMTGTLSK